MNTTPPKPEPRTIDVTLDGEVLSPPRLWSRLSGLWRALPPGSLPMIAFGLVAALALAVLLLGVLLVAVPILVVLLIVSALFRGRRLPGALGPRAR